MEIEAFIRKWSDREGGAERANAAMYLVELTAVLGVPAPDPAGAATAGNDYVFERAVRSAFGESGPPRRIDLYKKGCFLLEAKQSRWSGSVKADPFDPIEVQADMLSPADGQRTRGWDTLMRNALTQARGYVADLPPDHPAPPFLIICDVARSFEIWADFSGTGRGYAPFPDLQSFRIRHADLACQTFRTGCARSGQSRCRSTRPGSPPPSHAGSSMISPSSPDGWSSRAFRRKTSPTS